MTNDNMVWVQILAAVLSLVAAGLGWVAKSWSVRDQLDATESALKAKDEQLQALQSQIEFVKEVRPALIHDHLVRACHDLDAQIQGLVAESETKRNAMGRASKEIETQRLLISQGYVRITDLEEQKKSLDVFSENVQKLVHESGSPYFQAGETTMRGIAQERGKIYARIEEEQQTIDGASRRIAELEEEMNALQRGCDALANAVKPLEIRRNQLQIAAEALSATQVSAQPLIGPSEPIPIDRHDQPIERIDVPRIKAV